MPVLAQQKHLCTWYGGSASIDGGNNACFILHKTEEQSVMLCSDITLVFFVGRLKSGAFILK